MEKIRLTLQLSVLVMGLTLAVIPGCKTATAPQAAECGAGSLPCEDNITECCEVICPELHHHCGDFLTECCLDTTSHNFIWEIDTLGGHNSYLKDVAIIDENNIWAVGDIRTDSGRFNLAKWNGDRWDLHLFGVAGVTGDGIHVFSENDVWVATGIIYHWNNGTWERYHLWDMGVLGPGDGGVTSVWGSSPSDIWFVGDSGSIVHYDGSGFTRMESGTEVDLKDIDGTADGEHVFAVGWDNNIPAPSTVLELIDGVWNTLYYTEGAFPQDGDVGWVWGVGVHNATAYMPTTAGLWKYNYITQDSVLIPNTISYMDRSAFVGVKINSINDIFFAGTGFKYNHFNGNSYYYSHEITDMYPQRAMLGSDYNDNLAVMVGYFNWWEGALIAKGFHE